MRTFPTAPFSTAACAAGALFEAEVVQRQPGLLADPEGPVFDCLIDVLGGGADQTPAYGVEEDELVARVEPHVAANITTWRRRSRTPA
jgi:hypothetical protein